MSQRMWIRLMLMATVAVAVEEEKMPGIVIRISQKCLDHVSKQGTELLQKKLLKITLPIQMVVGEFELIRMMISKFMWRKSHISMVSKGFILSMTNGSVVVNGKWTNDRAKNNHIPFDLKLDGVIIKVSFNLGKNNKDLISISVLECIICFDDINILTSTNQNFLRDMYKNYFQATLHNNMVQKIRRMIRILTTSYVEPYLHSMPVKVNVDGIAGIDYSLLQPPKFEDDHVDISLKGQFFGLTHYTLYSFPPSAVNFRSSQLQMVYFGVSHSFFIPQTPGLSKNFPSMTMKIIVNFPSSVPTIFIDSRTKLNLMSSLSTHVFAIFSNSSETPPFTLKLPQSGIEIII